MADFTGKVAVITGGARGFGRAFGEALTARGARAILADIDSAAAESTAAQMGPGARAVALDVADEDAVTACMTEIARREGGIDILINNAGIHSVEASKPIGSLGIERTRRMFGVNVWGVVYCTLAAAPYMRSRPGAAIVNLSSISSYPSNTAYGVTKLAVRGLTTAFAHELAPIRVNAIAPGLTFTDTIRAELPKDVVDQVIATQIIKSEGEVADIVEAMIYLVSPRSRFVTGECLRVSGGATLQA